MRFFTYLIITLVLTTQVKSQCSPSIPSSAIVVNTNTTNNGGFDDLWVCSGDTLISNGGIRDIFLEPGAVLTTGGGIDNIYVKNGAKVIMTGGIHDIYYENLSNLTLSGGISTPIFCSSLNIDYSNAPANGCAPTIPLTTNATITPPTCFKGCDGKLTAVPSGGVPPYSFNWLGGPANASYNNICSGTYTVVVTDILNNVDSLVVNLPETPLIDETVLAGACSSYKFGNITLTNSGTYKDTMQSKDGCDSIVTLYLTISPINTTVTKNNKVLTATATGVNYQWLDCDNNMQAIPNATSKTFTGVTYGFYAVVVSGTVCTDTSECIGINPLSIAENNNDINLTLYPNPVSDNLNVSGSINLTGQAFRLIDIYGNTVYEGVLKGKLTSINTSFLSSGMYFLSIVNSQEILRFIKQ